jgi:hypothetical protein
MAYCQIISFGLTADGPPLRSVLKGGELLRHHEILVRKRTLREIYTYRQAAELGRSFFVAVANQLHNAPEGGPGCR